LGDSSGTFLLIDDVIDLGNATEFHWFTSDQETLKMGNNEDDTVLWQTSIPPICPYPKSIPKDGQSIDQL